MATRTTKTTKTNPRPSTKAKAPAKKAAAKAAPKAKAPRAEAKPAGPRHPHGRVKAAHGSKEELAKTLAVSLARPDQDTDVLARELRTASNNQLLRLQRVSETVKQKYGDREKLIAAIGAAQNKSKDKDYLAKLDTYSLPQLLDIASSNERRTRARA